MKELLKISHVTKHFTSGPKKKVVAVNDVSLEIEEGENLGIVGESGCGKSTLARMIMGALKPTFGEILFEGTPLVLKRQKERIAYAKKVQIVFQDPYTSLDPRMTAGHIISENLEIHGMKDKNERQNRVEELLEMVGLNKEHSVRFPHEFSGGQRQRIGIARALAANPKFLVCDEPISALDVSVQSQIMNLLKKLSEELNLTYLFIAHDLHMVRYISKRIAVMYAGQVVELTTSDEVWENPLHPYTIKLMDAVLTPLVSEQKVRKRDAIREEGATMLPSSIGCAFQFRCPLAEEVCKEEIPTLREVKCGHFVACHKANKEAKKIDIKA